MQEQTGEQSTGAVLKAARQSAGLTIEQLSEMTRVRETLITAIERDELAGSGGDFYVRGHVKVIARAVGLDPDTVAHRYDQERGGAPEPVRAAAVFQAGRAMRMAERRGPGWAAAMGVALAVVVVFGVVKVLGGASDQVRTVGGRQATAVPSVPPNSPFTEPPRPSPTAVAMARKQLVVVKAKAKRSSYLRVRDAEGRELFAGTLKAGRSQTWQAPSEVDVLLADAGAVSVQVNGKDLGTIGERGQRVRRTFEAETSQAG